MLQQGRGCPVDVGPRGGVGEEGPLFGRGAPLLGEGVQIDGDIVEEVVVEDAGDDQLQPPPVGGAEGKAVADAEAEATEK